MWDSGTAWFWLRGVSVHRQCLLEVLRLIDHFQSTRGRAPGLAVSALSVITPVISSSGRCANVPWALETMILPLFASLPNLSAGKPVMPWETGCAEAVRWRGRLPAQRS